MEAWVEVGWVDVGWVDVGWIGSWICRCHLDFRRGGDEDCPSLHHLPPLVQEVTAPVSCFDFVLESVCKRHFGQLAGIAGRLGGPVAERRPKTMGRDIELHPPERHQEDYP